MEWLWYLTRCFGLVALEINKKSVLTLLSTIEDFYDNLAPSTRDKIDCSPSLMIANNTKLNCLK